MKSIKLAGLSAVVAASLSVAATRDVAPTPSHDSKEITDGEIAMIAVVAGGIDISYAHLALALSENADVRAFAKTMIQDHPAVNEGAGALVARLGIKPEASDVSRQLSAQAKEIVDELTTLRGVEFDERYAENELAYHEFVNTALREQFIPGATNDEFRDALKGALNVFEGHEQLARDMMNSVTQ